MNVAQTRCVLLAGAHHALSEGVRRLLSTAFEAIVMVADEVSLFETAARLQSELAVVDLTLARGTRSSWCAGSEGSFRTLA
jgi:DNA-binding NarL/FixJ family response regulator